MATTVLYLGGVTRSGSTVIDRALGHLPGFVSTGELGLITTHGVVDNRLCGCGERFRDCPFWRKVGELAFGGWDSDEAQELVRLHPAVTRHRHVPLMLCPRLSSPYGRRLRRYAGLLSRLYAAIAEVSGASVVVDSTKAPAYAYVLQAMPDADVRVAHLVRDSRGTAHSAAKQQVMKDSPDRVVHKHRYPPTVITARWMLYHLAFLAMHRWRRPQLLLRYEDFVRDPEPALLDLAHFAGAPAQRAPFVDGTTLCLERTHTMAGNDSKFDAGPVRVREDDAWRTALPAGHRRVVTVLSWPLLRRWGYLRRG
jgi:hypothetical protein